MHSALLGLPNFQFWIFHCNKDQAFANLHIFVDHLFSAIEEEVLLCSTEQQNVTLFCQDAINLHRKLLGSSKYFETTPSVQNAADLESFSIKPTKKK